MPIRFHSEGIDFKPSGKQKLTSWITDTIKSEGRKTGEITFIFCDDEYLLRLNKDFLNHHTLTDILTFDYSENQEVSGDIFISIPRIKENAFSFNVKKSDELHRVIIHGILHLCGYKDKTSSDKLIMRRKEDFYLSLRPF